MSKEIYIEKKAENTEVTDYQKLQDAALEMVQQLSGNLWTDYNDHDPGVTIMDAFNYALTELNYKLSFPIEEYLTDESGEFKPNNFGLFLPGQVYPSGPVTNADYRKLFFDQISDISDIWLRPSTKKLPGTVDILADIAPSANLSKQNKIEEKIRKLYNENRNLGETLGTVYFREKEQLELWGEVHLDDDSNAAEVLALIYFTCANYFNSGIRYHNLRKLLEKENDWSILLDGPLMKNGIIDDDSMQSVKLNYSVSELHYLIKELKGVKAVEKISLGNEDHNFDDEIVCPDILHSYSVTLPARKHDIQLLVLKNNKEVYFSFAEVQKQFKKLVIDEFGKQNQFTGISDLLNYPQGRFVDFSGYDSIQNDFPNFYGINANGVPSFYPDERKAQAKQLKGYLLLFDFITAGSMQEINQFRDLLQVNNQLPVEVMPDLSGTVANYAELIDQEKQNTEFGQSAFFKADVKSQLFNLLDALYGEESYLQFLNDFNLYNSSEKQRLQQRANFIQNEHEFMPARAQGVNLFSNQPDNVPGIKQWFSSVLGLPNAMELPVTNVFSEYSLRLLSDDEFYKDIKGLLNIDFVVNKLGDNFDKEKIFDVPVREVENPKNNYLEFQDKIYLLHHNVVFESFLRNGIFIDNYKIMQPAGSDFILAYHAGEQEEWIALGRFEKHEEAIEAANQLRIFLIDLNLQSENIYLIEHLLLNANNDSRCYTLQATDENGQMQFKLLAPVTRKEIEQLTRVVKYALENPFLFKIRETERKDFLVLIEAENQNAFYCQHRFESREAAIQFLDDFKVQKFTVEEYCSQREYEQFPIDFMDFTVTAVLPDWSARFYNEKFRAWCEELLEERRPAHLKINFLWLNAPEIRRFEKLYFGWRAALVDDVEIKAKSLDLARFINHHLNNK